MHFIKKLLLDPILEVLYCPTNDQLENIFMNAFTEAKFTKLLFKLGVHEVVIKGGYVLMPPSLSYCVTFLNPSILSRLLLGKDVRIF